MIGDFFTNEVSGVPARELSSLMSGLQTLAAHASQMEVERRLESIPGVGNASFESGGLRLTFDSGEAAGSLPVDVGLGLDPSDADLDLASSLNLTTKLSGELFLKKIPGGSGFGIDTAPSNEINLILALTGTHDFTGRLGFVDISTPDVATSLTATASIDLGCNVAGTICPVTQLSGTPSVTGTADIEIPQVDFTHSGGTTTVTDPGSNPLLELSIPNLSSLGSLSVDANRLGSLLNFQSITAGDALNGLGFVTRMLGEIQTYSTIGATLPVIGGSAGQLSDFAGALQGKSKELADFLSDDASADPPVPVTAKRFLERLCALDLVELPTGVTCAALLDPLNITDTEIEYNLHYEETIPLFTTQQPTVDLSLTEDLGDLGAVSLTVGSGDWAGTATIAFDFTLGFKTIPTAALDTELGLTSDDFDGDKTPNASDLDADGDGLDDDGVAPWGGPEGTNDEDDDADNVPETYTLKAGDKCIGLAAVFNMAPKTFMQTNSLDPDNEAHKTTCDNKAAVGQSVSYKDTNNATQTTTLTATQVCTAGARVFDYARDVPTPASVFRTLNSYADDSACASAFAAGSTFNFDEAVFGAPDRLPFRIYISTATPLLELGLDIDGGAVTPISATGNLGILDFGLEGTVSLDPDISVQLSDPGTSASDSKLDMREIQLAVQKPVEGEPPPGFASLVSIGLGTQDIEAHFELTNNLLFPASSPAHIDVLGDLSALNNTGEIFEFHSQALPDFAGLAADKIHLGHDLADKTKLSNLKPSDIINLIANAAEQLAGLGGGSVLGQEIPFVGLTVGDMVGFAAKFGDIGQGVKDKDPDSITALEDALNDALAAVGAPGNITAGVTADELTISFDASLSATKTYPFNFSIGEQNFAPTDGGASLSATAEVAFNPELGILFDDTLPLDQRIFVRNVNANFQVAVSANMFGSVIFGPARASIDGVAMIGDQLGPTSSPELTLGLNDPNSDGRITVAELRAGLSSPSTFVNLTYAGPFSATLNVNVIGIAEGTFTVSGSLLDIPNAAVVTDLNIQIPINLDTLVIGSTQTAKAVGRLMVAVGDTAKPIPFIGSDISKLSPLGDDLTQVATEIANAWEAAKPSGETFTNQVKNPIETALGCTGCVSFRYFDYSGDPVANIGLAAGIELVLDYQKRFNTSATLDGGFGFEPVFSIDANIPASFDIGYRVNIAIGLSARDGFYLDAGTPGGDAIQIFTGVNLPDVDATVSLLGLDATITDGTGSIGGTLAQEGDAGGFAVAVPEKIKLADVANRRKPASEVFKPRLDFKVQADLPLNVGVPGFPSLDVPILLNWDINGTTIPKPDLILGCDTAYRTAGGDQLCTTNRPVVLSAGEFLNAVIDPVLAYLGKDASPKLNPFALDEIRNVLLAEIPVLDTTVFEVAKTFYGQTSPAFQLVEFLLNIGGVSGGSNENITIGWFEVLPNFVSHPDTTGWRTQAPVLAAIMDTIAPASTTTASTSELSPEAGATPLLDVSFPVLESPASMIKIILGGELNEPVDFIQVKQNYPVTIGPSFNFNATLFDLDIGFLKGGLTVGFNGGLGVIINLGFGYDSTGLDTGNPLDGFYLLDVDGNEIGLGGYVQGKIDGHFSVLGDLASVRFRGSAGVSLNGGIDLYDESPVLGDGQGDGKMHLSEIQTIKVGHMFPGGGEAAGLPASLLDYLCMFQLNVEFKANLSFGGKAKVLGITVFNESWSDDWTIIDEAFACSIEKQVAQQVGDQLILNAGPKYAGDRFDGLGDIGESFTLSRSGNNITVDWNGTGSIPSKVFDATTITSILGDLGGGNDTVNVTNNLGVPMTLFGGSGIDTLNGSNLADQIDGGPGNDTINGGAGDDTLKGAEGDDTISGDAGNDASNGGPGSDIHKFAASWGTDTVEDGIGDTCPSGPGGYCADILRFNGATGVTGGSSFGEAIINQSGGGGRVTYEEDAIDRIDGSSARDVLSFGSSVPEGFVVDGRGGNDDITFRLVSQQRTVSAFGGAGTDDKLHVLGADTPDRFLLRAKSTDVGQTATVGFVAAFSPDPLSPLVDRVNYTNDIEDFHVSGGAGKDKFFLDDNATEMRIDGGDGEDEFVVGQIFEKATVIRTNPDGSQVGLRDNTWGVGTDDEFAGNITTRGLISNGVSNDATLNGDDGNDKFTIHSNLAPLDVNGGEDDDYFLARAFVLEGTVNMNGEGGVDDFQYAPNDKLNIDGGPGIDTFALVGTELADGFIIDSGTVNICPIGPDGLPQLDPPGTPVADQDCARDTNFVNIEKLYGYGLEGNDVFHVISSDPAFTINLYGDDHDDTFIIGTGTVDAIQGPVYVNGESDPTFDSTIPDPLVLPGEHAGGSYTPRIIVGTNDGDLMRVWASDATSGLTGEMTSTRVQGLGMRVPDAVIDGTPFTGPVTYDQLEFVRVELSNHADNFTVRSTAVGKDACVTTPADRCPVDIVANGGSDNLFVEDNLDIVRLLGGDGGDTATIGDNTTDPVGPANSGRVLDGSDDLIHFVGGAGDDHLIVDDSGNTSNSTGYNDHGIITGMELSPQGITHTEIELLDIEMGSGNDAMNVNGTNVMTNTHGNDGEDRFYISDTANVVAPATTDQLGGSLDDILSPLHVLGGDGRNQLMVSDFNDPDPNGTPSDPAHIDYWTLNGFSPAPIYYDATGDFGYGISIWGSEDIDNVWAGSTLAKAGVRHVTMFNANTGDDVLATDLHVGDDDFFVANMGPGNDTVDASRSTLSQRIFGGPDQDHIVGGQAADFLFGDNGEIAYGDSTSVHTNVGHGGTSDITDGVPAPLLHAKSNDAGIGADDQIYGNDGNDLIVGGFGSDSLSGGNGNDRILGGAVNHEPLARPGIRYASLFSADASADAPDIISGGPGADLILGQQGDDQITGGADADHIIGGHNVSGGLDADDRLSGGSGPDVIAGDNSELESGALHVLLDVQVGVSPTNGGTYGPDIITGGTGPDIIYGQGADDLINGDEGDDTIEGNHGADTIGGGAGNDDIIGGGSANDGVIDGDRWGSGLIDTGDDLYGDQIGFDTSNPGDGNDVILGDNGRIDRTGTTITPTAPGYATRELRTVKQPDRGTGPWSGSDFIHGGGGDDDLYGQTAPNTPRLLTRTCDGRVINSVVGDLVCGGDGNDGIVTDLGYITSQVVNDQHTLQTNDGYVVETVHQNGSVIREVEVLDYESGDADIAFGGAGVDHIHTGGGDDLANAGPGNDVVFGGRDNDVLWGGADHDRIYGGRGADYLDIKWDTRRPAHWFEVAPISDLDGQNATGNGNDLIYGGWDHDALQADTPHVGTAPSDRLLDWVNDYNAFYVCGTPFGAPRVIASANSDLLQLLRDLAVADGAVGTYGTDALALVDSAAMSSNASPVHPDGPGGVTCEQ